MEIFADPGKPLKGEGGREREVGGAGSTAEGIKARKKNPKHLFALTLA